MIDYSAFDEKNVKRFNGKLPGHPRVSSPFVATAVTSVFLLLLFSPVIVLNPLGAPAALALAGGVIYLAYRLTWGGRDASLRSALFAQRNNFSYSWQGGKFKALEGLGSILGEPNMSNVITGEIYGQKFTLCGIYSDKIFKTVMRVSLPNNYPHILLDAKENNLPVASNLLKIFPKNKEIVLEGDFPNYFRVFTATTPTETLQILSPDLMAKMIDYTHWADIEIIDDQLLLVSNFKFNNKDLVSMLFEATEQILENLGVKSNNSKVDFDAASRII